MATEKVSTPVATPGGGNYSSTQTVALTSVTSPGVSIYYTTDGTTPDATKTLYTVPISISVAATLKAIGIKTGEVNSDILTAVYTFATDKRSQIMVKVATALTGITTGAGYQTNLGQKVYEWREYPIEDDAPPACVYKETDTCSILCTNTWRHKLNLDILLYGNTAAQVRQMIADVTTAIGTDTTFGGLVQKTEPTGEDTGAEHKNKLVFISHLTFEIWFNTTYWSAYS